MSPDKNQTPQSTFAKATADRQVRGDNFDVAIAGGGLVGMTLAVALAREGLRVAIIEKTSMPAQLENSFDGRVTAVAAASKNIFANIGVWEHMAPHAEPITDIRVSDGATPIFLHYDHKEIGSESFGYIVENRYIRNALQTVANTLPNITIYEKSSITRFSVDDMGVTIELPQVALRARLLVGAEGKQSPVRKMAGIDVVEWPYEQTAIVCTIKHEKSHEGLAQERFLPAGPFAVLPMTGNRSSLVWVEPKDRVQIYMDLPEDEFVQEITERVGDYLGKISVEGARFSYPLSLLHAKTYIGKRLALIGDAAHGMHPIAGQGVNVGFRDVAVLAELVSDQFKQGLDIGDAATLAHYQQWRRFDNTTMLFVTDGLTRLFSNNIVAIKLARNLGMWAVGKMPPVKRFFMRHAMGYEGDVPRLAKKA